MRECQTMSRNLRSVLYVPASNQKAIVKAQTLPCDAIILDLEDSVAPEAKEAARCQAIDTVRQRSFGSRTLIIRVNSLETEWGLADIEEVSAVCPDAILVPKVNSAVDIHAYEERLRPNCKSDVWSM